MYQSNKIAQKVKQRVLAIDPDAELILFGSRARGDAKPDSDWDFLVLTKNENEFDVGHQMNYSMLELETNENVLIQLVVRNKTKWETKHIYTPLFLNIKDDGIKI